MELCKPTEDHRNIPRVTSANNAAATALDSMTCDYIEVTTTAHVDGCNDNDALSLSTTSRPHMPLPEHTR
jgi:hypothetical protein